MPEKTPVITRRQLLAGVTGAAVAAGTLAACGGGDSTSETESVSTRGSTTTFGGTTTAEKGTSAGPSATGLQLPTYIGYEGVEPDLPASADGVPAGFLTFPSDRKTLHPSPIGNGQDVSAMCEVNQEVPPSLGSNRYWQALNKRLGFKLNTNYSPDYVTKLRVTMAGNEIPDLLDIPYRSMPRMPDVLEHSFHDLTEHLSGDAVKKYPGLANLPTASWRGTTYNRKIFGVPTPRGVLGTLMIARVDLLEKAGASTDFSTPDEYLEACRAVTSPKQNRWAVGIPPGTQGTVMFLEMFHVPNSWKEADGKFISAYETDQIKDALSFISKMWKEGLIHPDSFTAGGPTQNTWIINGTIAMRGGTSGNWTNYASNGADVTGIHPPGAGGEPAHAMLGLPLHNITAISKTAKVSPQDLLALLDYLASPFGTNDYVFVQYGIEGYDFEWKDGSPERTAKGKSEVPPTKPQYLAAAAGGLFTPDPAMTREIHEFASKAIPTGVADPTFGLFSDTDLSAGPSLTQTMSSVMNDVIQGRKNQSDWDGAVKTWRSKGGDKIRKEYEESFANESGN